MKVSYDLSNSVVVISGAASSICAAIAAQLSSHGATVIGLDIKTQIEKDELRFHDTQKVHLLQVDVTDEDQVRNAFYDIRAQYGSIDLLINGVGIYPHTRLKELTSQEWRQVIDGNLTSTYLCTRYFALEHPSGHAASIVNIASINGLHSEITHHHYGAAKAGIIMFTKTSALDLASQQIRVNAIAPGLVDTPGLRKYAPERLQRFMQRVPLKTIGRYEDIADAVLFFWSADWVTGQTLIVDGGVTLAHVY
ncbi:MAG TPA: SDR family NAD(P)-dependent oxidoreductase [Ktedonobacteraceae bacterium]|nr:SDR family NAD(P)-dependent oxidoreductase [Ktedonobacteraceae bacterium]